MSMDRADRQALLAVVNQLFLEYRLCVWFNGVVGRFEGDRDSRGSSRGRTSWNGASSQLRRRLLSITVIIKV